MANENNDIGDIVKKCKILLLDIEGTTTSISFVKDKLFPYAEEHVKDFLTNHWDAQGVKEVVAALRKLALEDKEKSVDGVVTIPGEDASKEDQIEALVKSVKWQMSSDRKVGPLKELQGLVWKQGYVKGEIKGHVYDDVSAALEQWRSIEGQKVYIYSSGSVQAQKLLFGQTVAGDLLKSIDGHFDTAVGAKQESASYTAIAEKIGSKPEEILFLTDIVQEAEAARASGMQSALVSREGNIPLPADAATSYPVLYSLATLANPNKRKPDAQDEQPAKVLKTDVDADVKTTEANVAAQAKAPSEEKAPEAKLPAETKVPVEDKAPADIAAPPKVEATPVEKESTEAKASPETIAAEPDKPAPKAADEPEKMDVEEEVVADGKDKDVQMDVVAEKVATIIEEVTDTVSIEFANNCEPEPIIEESSDKTEKPETEKMETETSENVPEPKESIELKNGAKDAPVAEETPPASVITEIKDVTNDKEELNEVAEIIEDIEPVIEEPSPSSSEMEELQNVGEVLDKECDEILSKVQDACSTLDNIPLKPLLNTIAEESMETENLDTNDIVERILDSEMEMEMKQNEETEKALKAAADVSETKVVAEENIMEKPEVVNNDATKVAPEEKPTDKIEEVKATEDVDSSSPMITEGEDNKVASVEKETKTQADEKIMETEEKKMEKDEKEMKTDEKKMETDEHKENKMETDVKKMDTDEKKMETDEKNMETNVKSTPETDVKSAPETDVKSTPETDVKSAPETDVKSAPETDVKSAPETDVKSAPETDVKSAPETDVKSTPESDVKNTPETDDSKTKLPDVATEKNVAEHKIVTEDKKVEDNKPEQKAETVTEKVETPVESKETQKAPEEAKPEAKAEAKPETKPETKPESELKEKETKEAQLNGKATNGDASVATQNGNSSKEEELSSRLTIENGKEAVNGANGDETKDDEGKSEKSTEVDVADIKVKTVAVDEPRNDPIEQPTEA